MEFKSQRWVNTIKVKTVGNREVGKRVWGVYVESRERNRGWKIGKEEAGNRKNEIIIGPHWGVIKKEKCRSVRNYLWNWQEGLQFSCSFEQSSHPGGHSSKTDLRWGPGPKDLSTSSGHYSGEGWRQ